MADTYKVFPSIGVARIGNSTEADNYYYIAPETSGGLPILPDGATFSQNDFRDNVGNLKRQGARFRVYCFPEEGSAPYEVLPNSGATIEWTVHVANKKPIWYEFEPIKGEGIYPPSADTPLRNPTVTDPAQRAQLIIDPGPRTLIGPGQSAAFSRDSDSAGYTMTFPPTGLQPFAIDTLGEALTDSDGRLIVIGALGHSGTDQAYPPGEDLDYVNNNNWWDDTADGPVSATVVLSDGTRIEADPAWVVVPPPAYVPEIVAQITMYDVIYDVAVRYLNYRPDIYDAAAGGYQITYKTYRKTEIEDLLNRALPYSWVSTDVGCHTFNYDEQASGLYQRMRGPDKVNENTFLMPILAGDGSASSIIGTPGESKYVTFTETQMFLATQWNAGNFTLDNPPLETEPDQLTRAALDNCSGAAFAPGIEMTWFARRPEIYAEAFRLKKRDYRYPLSTDATPLEEGLEPGDFIKFMAIPWQADFNECATQDIDNKKVHWWPAQRMLMVNRLDGTQNNPWVGTDNPTNPSTYLRFEFNTDMVEAWAGLGFVFNTGTSETPNFVEVQRTLSSEAKTDSKRPKPKFPSRRRR